MLEDAAQPARLLALRNKGNSAPIAHLTGMVIEQLEPGMCRVVIPYKLELMQAHGRMHGGVFGLLADTAGYFAAASLHLGDGVTVEYKLNLLEGVADEGLVAQGRVVKSGKTIVLSEVDVFTDAGVLVAKALATYRFFAPRTL